MVLPADDVRDLLLVRAYEHPPTAPWTEADARWASEQAQRSEGHEAPPERWLRRRAALALERLQPREPRLAALRRHAMGPRALVTWCTALAFVLGVAGDAIAPGGRINILAPPLLLLIGWNLVVYLGLAARGLDRGARPAAGDPLRAWLGRLAGLPGARALRDHPALARFAADWGAAMQGLAVARSAQALHAGAAAFAAGALASMYLRGLAFEFHAGWDSTFLAEDAVSWILHLVLGPASALTGIGLPDENQLAALRFSVGNGENAAHWIHLYAVTVGAVVILPRLLLSAWNGWQAHRLARRCALPIDDLYFQRLLRAHRDAPALVQVLPYNYRLPLAQEPGLHALLDRVFGPKLALRLAASIPEGAEDQPGHWMAVDAQVVPEVVVGLLPLAATPERETHGAFLESLARVLPTGSRLVVLIDESGFRERLRGADAQSRLTQRRRAWRTMLDQVALAEPPTVLFCDLAAPDLEMAERALRPMPA